MADREAKLKALSNNRSTAPQADPEEVKRRNQEALAKRKAQIAAQKADEATRPLPEGWRRVESRSRPGEFVYENVHTEERQAWFPDAPANEEASAALVAQSAEDARKQALKAKNLAALQKRKQQQAQQKQKEASLELPEGWRRTESRSRPGETVYENTFTGERQAWFPDAPAVDPSMSEEEVKRRALMEKNRKALEARKAKLAEQKAEEASRPLPEGWRRVESRSRPGEYVYENTYTEERIAWFPEEPAEPPLPEGWRKVESRTYPGEYVFENIYTLDRQAWRPEGPAPKEPVDQPPEQRTQEQLSQLEAAKPEVEIICKARALYPYTAENREEEIDLLEGDVVAVEYKADNGWWVGINTRTQRNGIFPGTYVEEM
jgi:coenzyme F420-reducing hydrogenase beta subunit